MYLANYIDDVLESKKNKLLGTTGYYKFVSTLNRAFGEKDLKFKFESFADMEKDYYSVSGLYDMSKDMKYVIFNFSQKTFDITLMESAWEDFKFFVSQVIQHETIHQNQWIQREEVFDAVDCDFKISFGSSSIEEEMDYLSDPDEIDAYAHDIAMEIKYFYSKKDPYSVLKNINKLRKIPSYSIYKKTFRGFAWNDVKNHFFLKLTNGSHMPEWLDVIQLVWLVAACFLCYIAGKNTGIRDTVEILMETGIVTKEDLQKLDKKLQENDVD